jgi:hypothetical protein
MPLFPDPASAGGLIYRKQDGTSTPQVGVENAYPPAPAFGATCDFTALPSDCTARVEPRQVNAIVSELLSFAECLNPNGTWDCASLKNLCSAFSAWVLTRSNSIYVGDAPPPNPIGNQTVWWESDTGYLYLYYNDGNSTQWVQINGNTGGIYVAPNPHPSPTVNQTVWWETDTDFLWLWYDDGTGARWVQMNAAPPSQVSVDGVSIIGTGTPADPFQIGLVDGGTWA